MSYILAILAFVATATAVVCGDGGSQRYGPDVTSAAEFGVAEHNRMSNYPYAYKVISVLSDTSQVRGQ